MKMILLTLLIPTLLNACGDKKECVDFHKGHFTLTTLDDTQLVSKVTRNGNEQYEKIIEMPEELKSLNIPTEYHAKIEWITECSYRMTYDGDKMDLTPLLVSYNESGGILVELDEIKNGCFFYTSSFNLEGSIIKIKGKLCEN